MTDRDLKVVSWNGHSINDTTNYVSGFNPGTAWGLPTLNPKLAKRDGFWPLVGGFERLGRQLRILTRITGANKRTLRDQLLRWFDSEDETPKQFVIEDEDGTNDRYVYAVCDEVVPIEVSGIAHRDTFLILLTVHGDVRWRSTSETSDNWSITASGQTNVVANGGTDDAYPRFEIEPTSGKAGGYDYKRYIDVVWLAPGAMEKYPFQIGPVDTATLTTAKMQADGDDLRMFVDGVEVPRWLVDMDTANTYIWINADFAAAADGDLQAALAGSGTIDSIEIGEGIYDWPDTGLCMIDSEVFSYTARDLFEEKLTGITRALHETSMAAHSVGATVFWIQHEIVMVYGNSSATAPTTNYEDEPMFVYSTSDNEHWQYTDFGHFIYPKRPGRWEPTEAVTIQSPGGCYTADQRALAYAAYHFIGAWSDREPYRNAAPAWILYNPCGIINAAWTTGSKRAADVSDFHCFCSYWIWDDSFWTRQYEIPAPSVADTWEAWSKAKDGSDWDEADQLMMVNYFYPSDVQVSQVDVYLSATYTPDITIQSETGNYRLVATITNNTTGESIQVYFDMALDEVLIVNTDDQTITYDLDDTPQFQAITLSSVRRHWLKLVPGNNTLQFDDTGTAAVTLDTYFEARYY